MLKRSLIALLLAFACLLASCTKLDDDNKIPTDGDTNTTPAASKVEDLIGKWYSAESAVAFEFFENNTVALYQITLGYYEYDFVEMGTYTYDGVTLDLDFPVSQSDLIFTCSVDSTSMQMTDSYETINLVPITELPVAHPTYSFPDFETLAQTNPLPNGNYVGLTIESDVTKESLLEQLTTEYWLYVLSSDETENKTKFEEKLTKRETGIAAEGQFVNINYEGKVDGIAFEGGTATNQIICLKDGTGMIDGFCVGVIGKEVGATFDVPVTFPENYHAELAGKDAVFTMTLNYIYDGTVLSDEIAVEQGMESLEEWIDTIYKNQMISEIWNMIPDLKDAAIPAEAYTFFHQFYLDTVHANAFHYFDNDFNAALTEHGHTEESLLKFSQEMARLYLQGAQIAAHFDLTPSEELTDTVFKEYMNLYNLSEEQAREHIENEGKFEFRARLLRALSAEYLLDNNTFVKTSD